MQSYNTSNSGPSKAHFPVDLDPLVLVQLPPATLQLVDLQLLQLADLQLLVPRPRETYNSKEYSRVKKYELLCEFRFQKC